MTSQTDFVNIFSVRDSGAKGDGVMMDTPSIQAAIDTCAADHGGTVYFPAGTYLSGTLTLKDNVTLYLSAEATLLGSDNVDDYAVDDPDVSGLYRECLLYARGAKNIGLAGPGVIDGQGRAFPHGAEGLPPPEDVDTFPADAETYVRPALARFTDCAGVALTDVTLQNSAHFAVTLVRGEDVKIRGVRVETHANQNGDGFQLIHCRNVFISDTWMSCSDDCIPMYGSAHNIVITNSVFSSSWAAFRFGLSGSGEFKGITISNCVIHDTFGCAIKMQQVGGGVFEDILFDNLVMDNVTGPISLRLAQWRGWRLELEQIPPVGTFRNVQFSNIRARVPEHSLPRDYNELRSCLNITGLPGHPVEGITFSNVHITYAGGGTAEEAARRNIPELETHYPEYFMFGTLPAYGMYVRHARGLTLHNVTFDLEQPDLRPALVCDDVENLELDGFRAEGNPKADALVRLHQTREAFIHGCRPLSQVSAFVRVEGPDSRDILLVGNDLRKAETDVEVVNGATEQAVVKSA